MLARVGRLLPYNCQIANHSNHTTRPALSFSSVNSFSWSKDGNETDLTIHEDDWRKRFTGRMEMTHYQHASGQWGGWGNIDEEVSLCIPSILGVTIITGCNLTSTPGQMTLIFFALSYSLLCHIIDFDIICFVNCYTFSAFSLCKSRQLLKYCYSMFSYQL